jgi:hypothetical protein
MSSRYPIITADEVLVSPAPVRSQGRKEKEVSIHHHDWCWAPFFIGLLAGFIIIVVLVWIAYGTRILFFSRCAGHDPYCAGADYFNDPGQAIAGGANQDDILFLNDNGQMFYKRVPQHTGCHPDIGQIVPIVHPQYCNFTDGVARYTGRSSSFNSPHYTINTNGGKVVVETDANCAPIDTDPSTLTITSGSPILKWDATV